ncbi:MAG: cation transporter [Burkholderiales bacterium]|nr:cation transporter [Burkholderiales bacterium]
MKAGNHDHPHHDHPHHDDHDHDHDHGHHHGHVHAPASFGKAFAVGCILNTGFVLAEWLFGAAAHSLALMADAVHNLGDVLALLLAWGAAGLARRPPSGRFTYGLRGSSILAALLNAAALLVVTGGLAWEAALRLSAPEPVRGGMVIAVALAGVLVNGITAWMFMAGGKKDLNLRGVYLHMAADAAVSLAVAIAGAAVLATGWNWLDPALTLVVSALILWSAWGLLRQSLGLALQAVPAGIDAARVQGLLAGLPGVAEVHDLHIWAMSTSENALTAHLVMPGGHPGDAFLRMASERLEQGFDIHHATLQIEVAATGAACALAPEHVV